jgi:chaperonin GroES
MLKVLNDKILIKKDPPRETLAGSLIILPETARKEEFVGTVISTGKGITTRSGIKIPSIIRPNDKVIYSKYAGKEVMDDKEQLYVFKESEIIAIINEQELIPINDVVICTRLDADEKTAGGLFLPIPHQKAIAKVKWAGRGILNQLSGDFENNGVQCGDIVFFEKCRGHDIEFNDIKYICLGLDYLLGIYKEEDLVNGQMDIILDVEETLMA